MKSNRDIYHAIADPTRREIINLIAARSYNLNSIAENFDMTRQAVSLHVKVLVDCGLVVIRQQGRERYCELEVNQLNEVATWIEKSKSLWQKRFEKLEGYLKDQKSKRK